MNKLLLLPGAVLGLFLLLITSCQETDQTGRIVLSVSDEPVPLHLIDEANVTITKVELRAASADDEGDGESKGAVAAEPEESPFIVIYEGEHTTNLAELRNGVTDELANLDIPADAYDLVRVHVKDADITLEGYGTFPVNVPSGAQTGVKIFIKPGIILAGGETVEVLLDFSIEKSFVPLGDWTDPENIKGFNFKPVIRAVNNSEAGMIKGFVFTGEEPLGEALVYFEEDGERISTLTEEDGSYAILGVPAGIYQVTAEKEGYLTPTPTDVEVLLGRVTEKDFVLSALNGTAK
jgi:hypothetical protein